MRLNVIFLHKSHKYYIRIIKVLLHSEIENSGTPKVLVLYSSYMKQKSCTGLDLISWILKLTAFLLHTHSRTSPEWWDILSHIHDRTLTFLVLPADLNLTEALMVKIKETKDFCHHALTPVPRRSALPTKTLFSNI